MERDINIDERISRLTNNIRKIIVGKDEIVNLVITAMLAGGHILIEDVPGVGKTKLVASMASSCKGSFNRLQMTPDVMPGDITGFSMIDPGTKQMEFRKGVAFCNFLLADEINRSSPKSQSALLEVMEEHQISIDGTTYRLPEPFMVLATQNMVETYGTYHLPEAQMDRFIMKISMGYPEKQDELLILKNSNNSDPKLLENVITTDDIVDMKNVVETIFTSDAVLQYIIDISNSTRNNSNLKLGISPRGSIALLQAAKAFAYVSGRNYVLPDDIKYLAPYVLAHRIILSPHGKSMWNNEVNAIKSIINELQVPVVYEQGR